VESTSASVEQRAPGEATIYRTLAVYFVPATKRFMEEVLQKVDEEIPGRSQCSTGHIRHNKNAMVFPSRLSDFLGG
jgi:hypothetical protein